MYVPVISCYFCEIFVNSTFNFRHRLSLHTKGYRILHSRQGSLDRHSFNNYLFELKSANCIVSNSGSLFYQTHFRTNQLIAVAGSAHFNRSAQSLDACWNKERCKAKCTDDESQWKWVVEAHQYLDLPLWVPFRYRVLTPSLTGLIGTSWKVLVLMFDNAFLYMFAEPKINSLWFNTKIHAQA